MCAECRCVCFAMERGVQLAGVTLAQPAEWLMKGLYVVPSLNSRLEEDKPCLASSTFLICLWLKRSI